jgi:hypothetical protein
VEPAREYERLPPEGPPPGPWRESPWLAILAAIAALLIGGAVGYAIGESGKGEGGVTHTAANTTTVTEPPKTVTNTVTSTTVKETAAPANQTNEERRREAEADLRKVEKENQELKQKLEEGKP